MRSRLAVLLLILLPGACQRTVQPDAPPPSAGPAVQTVRFATFNASLHGDHAGSLVERLQAGDTPARKIAAVIQHLRADVLLLNEFDHDPQARAAELFRSRYLGVGQFGQAPLRYPYLYHAAVNTGVPSGLDIDGDDRTDGPGDGWGYGRYPGQYGMLVLSRYPIAAATRSFRLFRWSDLPDARAPRDPLTGAPWYPPQVWMQLRLSSKSHWDLPLDTPLGRIHLLAAHPTPPVFDGPEDRNGTRNFDEIRLWAEYIGDRPLPWLYDDAGRRGGLARDAAFVIAGDLNGDPLAGAGLPGAIAQLLEHPRVDARFVPRSAGAAAAALSHRQALPDARPHPDPGSTTAHFGGSAGLLRADYLLPSRQLQVHDGGVFWPLPGEPGAEWIDASDHRAVWIDLAVPD